MLRAALVRVSQVKLGRVWRMQYHARKSQALQQTKRRRLLPSLRPRASESLAAQSRGSEPGWRVQSSLQTKEAATARVFAHWRPYSSTASHDTPRNIRAQISAQADERRVQAVRNDATGVARHVTRVPRRASSGCGQLIIDQSIRLRGSFVPSLLTTTRPCASSVPCPGALTRAGCNRSTLYARVSASTDNIQLQSKSEATCDCRIQTTKAKVNPRNCLLYRTPPDRVRTSRDTRSGNQQRLSLRCKRQGRTACKIPYRTA